MSPDILIAGGGVAGMSTAYRLARRGAKVRVLERGKLGGESSWAGGGILFPLLPWDYSEKVVELARAGWEAYPEFARQLQEISGIDPEYAACGMLIRGADSARAKQWCSEHDFALEETDDGALWLPQVAQVRNPRLIKALRGALEKLGVEIDEGRAASRFHIRDSRIVSIETGDGQKLSAGSFLIAAGAWSRLLAGEHAKSLDIHPVQGQMLLFWARPGMLESIRLENDFYLIPRRDGHILAGSTLEDTGFRKSTTREAKQMLLAKALRLAPELREAKLVMHWAGLRPGSPMNIPTISRHPQIENLYLNGGHFRYGVTMAPSSAQLAANLILDGIETEYRWPA